MQYAQSWQGRKMGQMLDGQMLVGEVIEKTGRHNC
jgi:hypothetical protein